MKFIERIYEALKGRNYTEALAIGSIALIYLVGKLTEGKYEVTLQKGNFSFRPTQGVTEQKPQEAEQKLPANGTAQPVPEYPEQQQAADEKKEEGKMKQPET